MDSIAIALNRLNQRAKEANPEKDGDYTGADGLLYCGKCNTPKQIFVEELKKYIPNGIVSCMCKCAMEECEAEKERELIIKRQQFDRLRRVYISDLAYRKAFFADDMRYDPNASDAAKWYADNFPELLKSGQGLMFIGGIGTGKTFLACCIANALIDKGYNIWVTTLMPLLRLVGNFNSYESAINRVEDVDLLVIDDFGTINNSEYNQSLLFEVIDARLRSGKPLIITTNLSWDDFQDPPIGLERVYDRLLMMCMCEKSPIAMSGKSIRRRIAKERFKGASEEKHDG